MTVSTFKPGLFLASMIVSTVCMAASLSLEAATQPAADAASQAEEPINVGLPTFRLIDTRQYANSITAIFGPGISTNSRFPPTRRVGGLVALGSGTAKVTTGAFEVFDSLARNTAAQIVDEQHRDTLVPCEPSDAKKADDACAQIFLGKVGKLLFRRPLTTQELDTYVLAARRASETLGDFYVGLESALSGMLVAPEFLYFSERTEPDPGSPGDQRLDGYSRAMRLSLLFWNASPDSELLRAAGDGELYTREGIDRQVERLIASPRLEDGVRAFFEDWMIMEDFDLLAKDPTIYPAFSLKVATEAKEQMLQIIVNELVTKDGDYRDLYTTRETFLTQGLGALYRAPVQATTSDDWVLYELPEEDPRAGLLTQVGFLAMNAHAGRSSPTRRGMALREVVMCQKVPDPPPNVDFSIFEDPNAILPTARDRAEAHSTDKTCAGCHKITDPIGLALENFDGAAQYRERENGTIIDASGDLDGVTYNNAKGLGEAVYNNARVAGCVAKRVFAYGVGRDMTKADRGIVRYFGKQFVGADYKFTNLLRIVATSNAFYNVAGSEASEKDQVALASQANLLVAAQNLEGVTGRE